MNDSTRQSKVITQDLSASQSQMLLSQDKINRSTIAQSEMSRNSAIKIVSENDLSLSNEADGSAQKSQKMLYQEVPDKKKIATEKVVDVDEEDEDDEDYQPDPSEAEDKDLDTKDVAKEEANTKDKGRIIKDEQDEIVSVQFTSFQRYFRYAGGWLVFIPYLILLTIYIVVGLAINFYTQKWAACPEEEQRD